MCASIGTLVLAIFMAAISAYGYLPIICALILGSVAFIACIVVTCKWGKNYKGNLLSLVYIFSIFPYAIFVLYVRFSYFQGFQLEPFLRALEAGLYEGAFVSVLPLLPILLGWTGCRKLLMFGSSIIFGAAHVIANVFKQAWTQKVLENIGGKFFSTAIIGFIFAIVIVKAGKWGIYTVVVAHFFFDWILGMFQETVPTKSYIQNADPTEYIVQIWFTIVSLIIIHLLLKMVRVCISKCTVAKT